MRQLPPCEPLQSLGAPITDIWRLKSTDQRLYLYAVRRSSGTSVLGGIKIGKKKLFIRTVSSSREAHWLWFRALRDWAGTGVPRVGKTG